MSIHSIRRTSVGCAVTAVAAFVSSAAWAAASADQGKDAPPQIVATASSSNAGVQQPALQGNALPAHERGVRRAAAESNEALRRYIWRTRMIYDFYYSDFAPKE